MNAAYDAGYKAGRAGEEIPFGASLAFRDGYKDGDADRRAAAHRSVPPPPGAHAFTEDGRFISGDGYGGERM